MSEDARGTDDARLMVLTGPSGVGKTTVLSEVLRLRPDAWLSVSATTRSPRPGEVDGVNYFFVDDERFDELIRTGALLEHAEYAGRRYGTPRQAVDEHLQAGSPVILEIELAGARQVRAAMPEAQLVFLAPPDSHVLLERLTDRGTESTAELADRIAAAEVELASAVEFDVIVVNHDIEQAARDVAALL